MANVVGKRYVCLVCGSEFIVTKGGDGSLHCHGQPMPMKESSQPSTARTTPKGDE